MNVATEHRDHDSETSKEEQKLSQRALPTLTPNDALSAKDTTASDEAYKKLCLILTLMTLVIFVINIIQARLLEYITHPAWIIGLPAILFAFFLLWVVNHIRGNPDAFLPHSLDLRKRVRHAAMHIHAIKKDQEYCEPEPKKWPAQLARLGVVASVILNIVLVEFVYLNTSAIPAWETKVWQTTFPASSDASAPSFAVIEHVGVPRSATLVSNSVQLDVLCNEKNGFPNPNITYGNSRCLRDWRKFVPFEKQAYNYVSFDGNTYHNVSLQEPLDLWFAFTYNSTATGPEPILQLAAMGPTLLPYFENTTSSKCGLTATVNILALQANSLSLSPYAINDPLNHLQRSRACNHLPFRQYAGYSLALSLLGNEPIWNRHTETCDVANSSYDGTPCWSHISIVYSTLMNTTYTSTRGTNFRKILTEEGGIVGYVTFFTWFFDIFAK